MQTEFRFSCVFDSDVMEKIASLKWRWAGHVAIMTRKASGIMETKVGTTQRTAAHQVSLCVHFKDDILATKGPDGTGPKKVETDRRGLLPGVESKRPVERVSKTM